LRYGFGLGKIDRSNLRFNQDVDFNARKHSQLHQAVRLQRRMAAEMFSPLRAFKFTLLHVEAAEWSAGARF